MVKTQSNPWNLGRVLFIQVETSLTNSGHLAPALVFEIEDLEHHEPGHCSCWDERALHGALQFALSMFSSSKLKSQVLGVGILQCFDTRCQPLWTEPVCNNLCIKTYWNPAPSCKSGRWNEFASGWCCSAGCAFSHIHQTDWNWR